MFDFSRVVSGTIVTVSGVALIVSSAACGNGDGAAQPSPERPASMVEDTPTDGITLGGLYSIEIEEGRFLVAKVLLFEADVLPGVDVVHAGIFQNEFTEPPVSIDPLELTRGTISDEGFPGTLHMPIAEALWRSWSPRLLLQQAVAEDELGGYRAWQDAEGGVFTEWPFD